MKNRHIALLLLLSYSSIMVPWNIATPFKSLGSSVKNLVKGDPDVKDGVCYDACMHRHMPWRLSAGRLKAHVKLAAKMTEGIVYIFSALISGIVTSTPQNGQISSNGLLFTLLSTGYLCDWIVEATKTHVTLAHDAQMVPDHMLRGRMCKKDGHLYIDTSKIGLSRSLFRVTTLAVALKSIVDMENLRQDLFLRNVLASLWRLEQISRPVPNQPQRNQPAGFLPFQGEGHTLGST